MRKIFLAALGEHGFARTKANVNPEIATFGLGDPKRDDFVVVSAGKVVGFAIVLPMASRTGELAKLFVAPSHRKHGLATILVDAAIEAGKRRGYRNLFLETRLEFGRALRYYESRGWVADKATAGSSLRTYQLDLSDARRLTPAAAEPIASSAFWGTILTALIKYLRRATELEHRLNRKMKEL